MQVQYNLRAALQLAADEAAKGEHDDPIPSPLEVAQLVEEAMFGFYGAFLGRCHDAVDQRDGPLYKCSAAIFAAMDMQLYMACKYPLYDYTF